jgi:hypothetical protein
MALEQITSDMDDQNPIKKKKLSPDNESGKNPENDMREMAEWSVNGKYGGNKAAGAERLKYYAMKKKASKLEALKKLTPKKM